MTGIAAAKRMIQVMPKRSCQRPKAYMLIIVATTPTVFTTLTVATSKCAASTM